MTAADPLLPSLDERIAAAFAIGAKSADVATLIKNTERAASSAAELAEQARNHALDPTLSGNQLKDARNCMDDAAFKRDRLQAALGKLKERLKQLLEQEENAQRQVIYDKLKPNVTSWQKNMPTSIRPSPKSSPRFSRASQRKTASSITSTSMRYRRVRHGFGKLN